MDFAMAQKEVYSYYKKQNDKIINKETFFSQKSETHKTNRNVVNHWQILQS